MTVFSSPAARFSSVSMVTTALGTNDPEVGTMVREGDEEYILVYNAGNSQISKGYGAVVSAVTGYSVTVSSVASVGDMPIGVCVHATMPTASYGWLLKKGFCNFKANVSSAPAAGDLLTLADDGVWGSKTISTGFVGNGWGKVMVATASAGTGVAYFSIY